MLETLPTLEVTYKDNDKIMATLLKQLGFQTEAELWKLGTDGLMF